MKTYIVYKHQSRVTGKVYRGKIINKPTAYGYKWKFKDNLDL